MVAADSSVIPDTLTDTHLDINMLQSKAAQNWHQKRAKFVRPKLYTHS
jgi:hypothetical protein